MDDTDSKKSRKKGKKIESSGKSRKKVDGKSLEKSRRKRKELDDTNSENSRKKGKKSRKKRENLGSGWVHVPHIPVPIIWGRRSKKDENQEDKTWTCACGTTNKPSRHVFIDLPLFKCSNENCDKEPKHVDFRFSYGNLAANGLCPIGELIYNQKLRGDCFLFALAKGCEISANIKNILLGNGNPVRPLNPYTFKKHLEAMKDGVELSQIETGSSISKSKIRELLASEGIRDMGGQNVYRFGTLDFDRLEDSDDELDGSDEDMATEGIREMGGQNVYEKETLDCDSSNISDDALDGSDEDEATKGMREIGGQNLHGLETVDGDLPDSSDDEYYANYALANQAFEALATAIADGSPVITSITLGPKFKHLEYGKVYKAPRNPQYLYVTDSDDEDNGGEGGQKKKKVEITHAVVLVGAAREGVVDYYYFLNSHGVKFCVRVDNKTGKKTCGIGKICAEDAYLGSPFKILTFA